ncbi:hypothetical protein ABTB07_21415, partial [Acinetobacter baumannii]
PECFAKCDAMTLFGLDGDNNRTIQCTAPLEWVGTGHGTVNAEEFSRLMDLYLSSEEPAG